MTSRQVGTKLAQNRKSRNLYKNNYTRSSRRDDTARYENIRRDSKERRSAAPARTCTTRRPAAVNRNTGEYQYAREEYPHERQHHTRFAVCSLLFAGLVAVKLTMPEKLSRLNTILARNMDVQAVFSAVGGALSGGDVREAASHVYRAVFQETLSEIPEVSPYAANALASLHEYQAIQKQYEESFHIPNSVHSSSAANHDEELYTEAFRNISLPDSSVSEEAALISHSDDPSRTDGNATSETNTDTSDFSANAALESDTDTDINTNIDTDTEDNTLSYILYTPENLPDNVSMEQATLDFAYTTPTTGIVSSGFGYREHPLQGEERFHYGLDLAASSGTEIKSFAGGTVTAVGESSSYGKYCIISHGNGYDSLYAHCSRITVTSGTSVKMGDKIAEVGETGMTTGPHLHFELHKDGVYLNPIYYVDLG